MWSFKPDAAIDEEVCIVWMISYDSYFGPALFTPMHTRQDKNLVLFV